MIEQPKGTRLCGQIAVAHIADVPLALAISAFGHKHGTTVKQVIRALAYFGYGVETTRLRKLAAAPALGIGKMRWRKPDGNLRGWHWVAIREGKVWDGQEHTMPGEVTSWLVINSTPEGKS